jgi:LPS sulfotransferase NodH
MARNFIIVGTQRTGSTALYHSLNFHAAIACGGEWTQNVSWRKKLHVAQRALGGDFTVLSHRNRERINTVFHENTLWLGFKLLFRSSNKWLLHPRFAPVLWSDRLEDYLRWMSNQADLHIIHVVRQNAIEWLKSKYLASTTGHFAVRAYPDDLKVYIPLHAAVKRLQSKNWVDCRLATLSKTNPYLRLSYEDFLHHNHAVVMAMVEFFQCDSSCLSKIDYGSQQKQSTREARTYICNYDQLVAKLKTHNLLQSPLFPQRGYDSASA